jgi:hypothetical protein
MKPEPKSRNSIANDRNGNKRIAEDRKKGSKMRSSEQKMRSAPCSFVRRKDSSPC